MEINLRSMLNMQDANDYSFRLIQKVDAKFIRLVFLSLFLMVIFTMDQILVF